MATSSSICRSCGAPLRGGDGFGVNCLACLLGVALISKEDQTSRDGRFDHYQLVTGPDGLARELGHGAMGTTYRAIDTVLGHTVALKVIDSRLAAYPEARDHFRREARA